MFDVLARVGHFLRDTIHCIVELWSDGLRLVVRMVRSRAAVSAEILFLRKQLAFYREHEVQPRRLTDPARVGLVFWSQWFDWRGALMIVQPETLIGWHRKGFKLFWRRKSKMGRPRLPEKIRQLIVRMVKENPTWGQERVAAELSLKLGIPVSPRTVRAYWPAECDPRRGKRTGSQHWRTFVRNHAQSIVACDFLVSITASFRVLYVLVVMEVGSRRILHSNVTAHPTAEWALQQFREAIPSEHAYRFLIHDRDSIFSQEVDAQLKGFGLKVLRTPVQAPKANAYCERLVGTMRRECLDWMIPLNERHLRRILREWVTHYNRGRPHASLGPGMPEPTKKPPRSAEYGKHQLPEDCRIKTRDVLGGLHHEYWLEKVVL